MEFIILIIHVRITKESWLKNGKNKRDQEVCETFLAQKHIGGKKRQIITNI